MNKTFFTADTHFGHKNIASKNCSQWDSGYRIFKSLAEHDAAIVKNINSMVAEDDTLWHMGDWSFGGIDNIFHFRKQLRCQNIHLILGNHDHHIEHNKDGARGLFKSVSKMNDITIDKQKFILLHYSMRVWEGSHKGFIHLYGHSHNSLEWQPHGKSMDVGIDAAYNLFGEYRPFELNEILSIMAKRDIAFLDHHDANTNVK